MAATIGSLLDGDIEAAEGELPTSQNACGAGKGSAEISAKRGEKMDALGREAANTETGIKEQVTQRATQVKEKVADLGRKAGNKIDEQRVRTADAFDNTASALHEGGDRFASSTSNVVHAAADKIRSTADYLREHDARAVMDDFEGLIRRYPGQALAAAAVVGFLAGRALRGTD
jgi:ElaB/YqjD/DUF883 family membrane-anchored ribosome-binding protein